MTLAGGAVLTLLGFLLITAVYVVTQAVVGSAVGARVEVIALGTGPVLYEFTRRGITYRLNWIPTGGYTKFFGHGEELDDEASSAANNPNFEDLPPHRRIVILLSGPISNLVLGIILLGLPVVWQSRQLAVDPQALTPIAPSAVPNLGLQQQAATWHGQFKLFDEACLGFFRAVLQWKVQGSWGAYVGFLITSGAVVSQDLGGWFTSLGVISLFLCGFNLAPFPALNGGHTLFAVGEYFDKDIMRRLKLTLTIPAVLILWLAYLLMIWIDFCWCLAQWKHG